MGKNNDSVSRRNTQRRRLTLWKVTQCTVAYKKVSDKFVASIFRIILPNGGDRSFLRYRTTERTKQKHL